MFNFLKGSGQKANAALQLVDSAQQLALGGSASDPVAKGLIFGGFGATMVGLAASASGMAVAAKVLTVGGVLAMTGGFVRGFREGFRQVAACQSDQFQQMAADIVLKAEAAARAAAEAK